MKNVVLRHRRAVASLLVVAALLDASVGAAQSFVVYAKDDKAAAQDIGVACSDLRDIDSRDAIFVINRADPAISFLKALIEYDKNNGPLERAPVSEDACGNTSSDMRLSLRDCLSLRLNKYWDDPANTPFTPCFGKSAAHRKTFPLVAVAVQTAERRPGKIYYETFRIGEDGRVEFGATAYTSFDMDKGSPAGETLRQLLLGHRPSASPESQPSPGSRRDDTISERRPDPAPPNDREGSATSSVSAPPPNIPPHPALPRSNLRPDNPLRSSSSPPLVLVPQHLLDGPMPQEHPPAPVQAPSPWYTRLRGAVPGALLTAASWIPYAIAASRTSKLDRRCSGATAEECGFYEGRDAVRGLDSAHQALFWSGLIVMGGGWIACNFDQCMWPSEWWPGGNPSNSSSAKASMKGPRLAIGVDTFVVQTEY